MNFNNGERKYEVISCDGTQYGEKGYILECKCIHSNSPSMIGEEYSFDDRVFRDYNENNIIIEMNDEKKKEAIKTHNKTYNKTGREALFRVEITTADTTEAAKEMKQMKVDIIAKSGTARRY